MSLSTPLAFAVHAPPPIPLPVTPFAATAGSGVDAFLQADAGHLDTGCMHPPRQLCRDQPVGSFAVNESMVYAWSGGDFGFEVEGI